MQLVSDQFTNKTKGALRHLEWKCLISFAKDFNSGITFFTIGTSTIGGTDIIPGSNSVIQEWEKYTYVDYSARVLSMEYTRESDPPVGSISLAYADVVLDNSDSIFTVSNTSSPLYGNIADSRPIRLYVGYKDTEKIQVLVGMTVGLPILDEKAKTARFHCIDFFRHLDNQLLNQSIMLTDVRTDQAIQAILTDVGLLTSQSVLDTGTVIIPFLYYPKGTKVGTAIREIAEAELGGIYMDENGVIRFENRTKWIHNSEVWQFDRTNVIDMTTPDASKVINSVEVKSKTRAVEANQKVYISSGAVIFTDGSNILSPSTSKDIFIDFTDTNGSLPVTTSATPVAGLTTNSGYDSNTAADGSGTTMNPSVTITAVSLFATSVKYTFTNASSTTAAYINRLEVWATPAKVKNDIYVLVQDQNSIEAYEIQPHEINNNYIQDSSAANSIAQRIISDRAEIDDQRTITIKGVPQLQIGDIIRYSDNKTNQTYFITRINGILGNDGFRQIIVATKRTIVDYFAIGVSSIGGTGQIAP
jgi:hypothetical protein